MEDFKRLWQGISPAQRKELAIKLGVGYLVLFVMLFLMFGFFAQQIMGQFSALEHGIFYYGFKYFLIELLLSIVLFFTLIVLMFKKSLFNRVIDVDYRNLKFLDDTTGGDARWMNLQEMNENYTVDCIEDMTVPIYGQITDNGEEAIGYKKKLRGATSNQNVLVLAAMGMGKSFGPVRTNILQAVKRGESFVVTDPSGELYSSLAGYCRLRGMTVHLINLDKPKYSEFWNILEETIDPETERLDGQRLNDFADIYMKNTSGGERQDFWYGCALNLIKTVVGYSAWLRENDVLTGFIDLYRNITGLGSGDDPNTLRMQKSVCSFAWCKDVIRKAAYERDMDMEQLEVLLHDIQYVLPEHEFNMSEVFTLLLKFKDEEEHIAAAMESAIPDGYPAKIAYMMYSTNEKDSVKDSALQGAQLRFSLFTDANTREFLSHDGIHISDVTKDHTAFFVVLSDKTQTLKPIASLFFTFLFKDTQDAWDVAKQESAVTGKPNTRRELTVMLDEFFSIGVISGSPEAFGTVMSNSRKREIHIWIIVQGYSQLAALYGKEIGNVIQGGCSTILYLGGNDPDTVAFISNFVGGKATILNESHQETDSLFSSGLAGNRANVSASSREIVTQNEARRWHDKVLICSQGQYIVRANPFPWIQHPYYEECANNPVSIYETMTPIEQRVDELAASRVVIADPQAERRRRIRAYCERGSFEPEYELFDMATEDSFDEPIQSTDSFDDVQPFAGQTDDAQTQNTNTQAEERNTPKEETSNPTPGRKTSRPRNKDRF